MAVPSDKIEKLFVVVDTEGRRYASRTFTTFDAAATQASSLNAGLPLDYYVVVEMWRVRP